MRTDLNFFTPYLGRKKERKKTYIAIYSITASFILLILITLGYNSAQMMKLHSEIADINEKLEQPEIISKYEESKSINKKIEILGQYDEGLNAITAEISTRDIISSQLLNSLSSTLPSDVSFKSINITAGNIAINASSKTRQAIAEVQHNLKALPEIGDVYIGAISGTGENNAEFSFDLKCVLKGGN